MSFDKAVFYQQEPVNTITVTGVVTGSYNCLLVKNDMISNSASDPVFDFEKKFSDVSLQCFPSLDRPLQFFGRKCSSFDDPYSYTYSYTDTEYGYYDVGGSIQLRGT